MIGILIIAGLLYGIFKVFWKTICEWWQAIVNISENLARTVRTFLRQGQFIVARVWRRYRSGEITVTTSTERVEEIHVPEHIRKQLNMSLSQGLGAEITVENEL